MSERRILRRKETGGPDEQQVRAAIAPQIDRVFDLGFHARNLSEYIERAPKGIGTNKQIDPEEFRQKYRNYLQAAPILKIEAIEHPTDALLVIPEITVEGQTELLGIPYDEELWEGARISHRGGIRLPEDAYITGIRRGNENSPLRPKLLSSSPRRFTTITDRLAKQHKRGASIYELLAYAREHAEEIQEGTTLYATSWSISRQGDPLEPFHIYYPGITRKDGQLQCSAGDFSGSPASMSEILYAQK